MEENVVFGFVTLDHFGFEEEGVDFGGGDAPFGGGDVGLEGGGFGVGGGFLEVAFDAVLEVGGFADVDDLTAFVFVEIDAGFAWQVGEVIWHCGRGFV